MPEAGWTPEDDNPEDVQKRLIEKAEKMFDRMVGGGPFGLGPQYGSILDQIDQMIVRLREAPVRFKNILPPLLEVRRRLLQALIAEGDE